MDYVYTFKGETEFTYGIDTVTLQGKTLFEYNRLRNTQELIHTHLNYNFKIPPCDVYLMFLKNQTDSGFLDIHRDVNTLVVLNYYIQTSNDYTIFYEPKDGIIRQEHHDYQQDEVVTKDKFIAKSDESFLLDPTKLHSVTKKDKTPRVFFTFVWRKNNYFEVLESINDLIIKNDK